MTRLILATIACLNCVFLDLQPAAADPAFNAFAAAQTNKQKCMNSCRARYRDCRRLERRSASAAATARAGADRRLGFPVSNTRFVVAIKRTSIDDGTDWL